MNGWHSAYTHEKQEPIMNDHDPTSRHETVLVDPVSSATPDRSSWEAGVERAERAWRARHAWHARVGRMLANRKSARIMAAAVMVPVIGLSTGLATSPSAAAAPAASGSRSAGGPPSGGSGSNARSGPAAGGATGTVSSMSKSKFTLTTSAGQKVTVDEASATKYQKKGRSTSASAITKGEHVLVLGTTNSTTITASQVIVPTSSASSAASTAATVVPFQKGAPSTSKTVGQIPADYSQGSGTIVSGTTANKATEAALAAYPGGIVDRVVKLSNGEYEVHNIGVNWPHHIFVNQDFKVIGAE
jgi:hypothetical protein